MEKKGLGKGLGALIPSVMSEGGDPGTEVSVDRITFNPYQPRERIDDSKFEELVSSVRVHGILQPIVVRAKGAGEYELVAGERRLRAARAAGLKRIPVVVRDLTDEQSLQVALIENLQREDISPVDAAVAYHRLATEFDLSQENIALGLGKSRSTVANTMRLLGLPRPVLDSLKSGRISEGHARAILALDDDNGRIDLCDKVISLGLSVRETEKLAKETTFTGYRSGSENVSRETTAPAQDPNIQAIESHLRGLFGTKVTVSRWKDRGRIEIEFYTDDDFERILAFLTG